MPNHRNVRRLATLTGVTLASGGIVLMAALPAGASVNAPRTSAQASARPAVKDCGTGAALTRPGGLILTCADGGMVATGLRWESWTSAKATATANVVWRVSATRHDHTTADVTLSAPVREAGKTTLFTKLRLTVTGATPRGFIRDITFSEAPPTPLPPAQEPPFFTGPAASGLPPAAASGTLDTASIGGYWELAGGGSSVAETAEAITGAEASFDPGIIQQGMPYSTTGWGLWQITPGDSVPAYGEDYQLLDPWNNAEAAVYKYIDAGGFSPWTTYDDGAYESYVGDEETPNTDLTDPGQYEPIGSGPSGANNSSDPGSTYGPAIPGSSTTPPPTFAFKAVFQDNDNDLAGYSNSEASFTTTLGMKAGTGPSVCTLSDGTFEAAFEANNDTLAFSHLGGGTLNTTMGMLAGTSPSISALPSGGWVSAFQDNDNVLVVYTSSGSQIITDLGMDPGTNPAISVAPNGSYKVVFQDNDNVLAGYNSDGSNFTTTVGLEPGTSPSINREPNGEWEAAAEDNDDDLVTVHFGSSISVNPTTLGMDNATSPAITY